MKTSKGAAKGSAPASGLTHASAMAALEQLASGPLGRMGDGGLVADLRDKMGGTRDEQDKVLNELAKEGRVVLWKNDHTKSVTPRELDGAIQVPGGLPRSLIYIDRRAEKRRARDLAAKK